MTSPTTSADSAEQGSFVGFLAMLLRHPRFLFGLPLAGAVLAAVVAITKGPQFVARAELRPRAQDNRFGNLAGLAAQLGVTGAGMAQPEGVDYYAAVLRSNEIIGKVVETDFRFIKGGIGATSGDSVHGTLMDIWEIEAPNPVRRKAAAIRRLRASIVARPNLASGLLRFDVTARWPMLAAQINRRFLEELEAFNIRSRQATAASQRRFVEQRLRDMRGELTAAENNLAAFESRNRMAQAPNLVLERQRLQRQVDIAQQVYLTLAQGYEQARIDEVRDTPVVTVVDAPENTVELAGGLLLFVALGGFVGGLVGLGAILLQEMWTRQAAEHPEQAGLVRSAWRAVPARLLRRERSR